MITLVEALNYQCLRNVSHSLDQFQILVGPNASGKSTFLDVIEFVGDVVKHDLLIAVDKRTQNPQNLLYRHQGKKIELAVEAKIPSEIQKQIDKPYRDFVRYEISLEFNQSIQQFEIVEEKIMLLDKNSSTRYSRIPKSIKQNNVSSILLSDSDTNFTILMSKNRISTDTIQVESEYVHDNFHCDIDFNPRKSALGQLPEDENLFPTMIWFRNLLVNGVQRIKVDSRTIRKPSPPSNYSVMLDDGSNLPWLVAIFKTVDSKQYRFWIDDLQFVFPDLVDINTFERPEDKHCYLIYKYSNGLELPSWMVSEGTLRLTALTLPAYFKEMQITDVFVVEGPEVGIHPSILDAVFNSLSSIYESQVLIKTSSTAFVNLAKLENMLCFTRDEKNSTRVVQALEIPIVKNLEDRPSPGWLLASGLLE